MDSLSYIEKSKFWAMTIPANASWCWKKLLQHRPPAQLWISVSIGAGCDTFFWYVNWYTEGPLYLKHPESLFKNLEIYPYSKVADSVKNRSWNWSTGRRFNALVQEFQQITPVILLNQLHRSNHVKWAAPSSSEFSVKSAMKKVNDDQGQAAQMGCVWDKMQYLCLMYRGPLPCSLGPGMMV
nr:uncharacterized protein LOC113739283 [Coffea arabica]